MVQIVCICLFIIYYYNPVHFFGVSCYFSFISDFIIWIIFLIFLMSVVKPLSVLIFFFLLLLFYLFLLSLFFFLLFFSFSISPSFFSFFFFKQALQHFCNAVLLVSNSFSFFLSVKLFISLPILNGSLAG